MTNPMQRLMKAAKENIESQIPEELAITPEDAAIAEADTGLSADIATDIIAESTELDAGLTGLDQMEVDADSLAANADLVEATVEGDGVGAEPLSVDMLTNQVAAATEKWFLDLKKSAPSREAFNTSAGKRQATKDAVAFAREAEGSMRENAVAGLKAAWQWLLDILKQMLDKSHRLAQRAKAVAAKAGTATGGEDIKPAGLAVLGGLDPRKAADALGGLGKGYTALSDLAHYKGGVSDIEIPTGGLGGVTLKVAEVEGKWKFTSEGGEGQAAESVKSLSAGDIKYVCGKIVTGLAEVEKAKKDFEAINQGNSVVGNLAKPNEGATRGEAVARARAISGATNALARLTIKTAEALLNVCEKSLAPAAAPAADAAPEGGAAA